MHQRYFGVVHSFTYASLWSENDIATLGTWPRVYIDGEEVECARIKIAKVMTREEQLNNNLIPRTKQIYLVVRIDKKEKIGKKEYYT